MNFINFETQKKDGNWKSWKNVVSPLKYGKMLDEQLDYATVSLLQVKKKSFAPMTKARVVITSVMGDVTQTETLDYLIAGDSATESPVGSGIYNHELTLIEYTKFLEGFIVDNLCFTNPSEGDYTRGATKPNYTESGDFSLSYYLLNYPGNLKSPMVITDNNNQYVLPNLKWDKNYVIYYWKGKVTVTNLKGTTEYNIPDEGNIDKTITLTLGLNIIEYDVTMIDVEYFENKAQASFSVYGVENRLPLKPWTVNDVIQRLLECAEPCLYGGTSTVESIGGKSAPITSMEQLDDSNFKFRAIITVPTLYNIQNVKLGETVKNIVRNFTCKYEKNVAYLTGEIYKDDSWWTTLPVSYEQEKYYKEGFSPRFTFIIPDGKEDIFEQIAPEFTFTNQTLRECLQTIGGFIHAEPRLTANNEITFDFYGEQEYATYKNYKKDRTKNLSQYSYLTNTSSFEIEQACTRLDSVMENLVNRLAWQNSTVGQPYKEGGQTLRTESAYVMGTEDDSYFLPTAFPINQIVKVEYINFAERYDITPYVFESSVYNTLSSFDATYPRSKAYALNYTIGEKGIKGFFFKNTAYESTALKDYAIKNIIRAVSGIEVDNYKIMQFCVTYVPIYTARIQHGKQYLSDLLPLPRTVAYSQGANSVEARYYGENIKGAAQRLGNMEKYYTFILRYANNIPKAGQLWDDEYYIATVAVSVLQDRFEVTVGLSKHFNRISKYIGVSSYKRIYEVSEKMVQERRVSWTDYAVISKWKDEEYEEIPITPTIFSAGMGQGLLLNSVDVAIDGEPISAVIAQGFTKNGTAIQAPVLLPVVASGYGNVIHFAWEYKDNFSAGIQSVTESDDDKKEPVYGIEVPYSDYYGRIYYDRFALVTSYYINNNLNKTNPFDTEGIDNKLPLYFDVDWNSKISEAQTIIGAPRILRKDSRETIKCSCSLEFVTTENNFIIGSALAYLSKYVVGLKNTNNQAHLYVFPFRLNKFSDKVDLTKGIDLGFFEGSSYSTTTNLAFYKSTKTASINGKSWAYVIPSYEGEKYNVEDEDGNVTEYTPKYGGELLLGCNEEVTAGSTIGGFVVQFTHDLFKKS